MWTALQPSTFSARQLTMAYFKGWCEERRLNRHVWEQVTLLVMHLTARSRAKGQQLCFRMSLCGCRAHLHPTQEITASPGPALTCAPHWLGPCSPVGSEALLNSSQPATQKKCWVLIHNPNNSAMCANLQLLHWWQVNSCIVYVLLHVPLIQSILDSDAF